jgi:hypothetical protein
VLFVRDGDADITGTGALTTSGFTFVGDTGRELDQYGIVTMTGTGR